MCVLYCVGIEYCIFIIRRSSYQSTIINIFTGPVSLYDECENYPNGYIWRCEHLVDPASPQMSTPPPLELDEMPTTGPSTFKRFSNQ